MMKKKAAEVVEKAKPTPAEWWTRAGASFVTGLFFLWLTYMTPSSLLAFCLGAIGMILAIAAPIVFVVIAIVKENDWS